jgi:hypothetical protein
MALDLDTVLVAVYVIVDELFTTTFAAQVRRRGPTPRLADSEVVTLALLAQWRGDRSERAFLRYVRRHWTGYFPVLLSQSAFNRRVRALTEVLAAMGPAVAQRLAARLGSPPYEILDGIAVPLERCCRGRRHRCFAAEASLGHGGSDRGPYYGVELVATLSPDGPITGFVLTPAQTAEHWGVEALLRWRVAPTAPAPTEAELRPVLGPSHEPGGAGGTNRADCAPQRRGPTHARTLLGRSRVARPAVAPPLAADLAGDGRDPRRAASASPR